MKKVLATIGLASLVAASTYAQGFVVFSSSTQNISTNNLAGTIVNQAAAAGKTSGAGNYYYALFWSATAGAAGGAPVSGGTNVSAYVFDNGAGWTADTDPTATSASTGTAGRFSPTAPNADGTTTVPGTTAGLAYYFVVVGWSASLGTTLAQMEANVINGTGTGYVGESAYSGLITTGNGGLIAASPIMGGGAPTIQAFSLGAVTAVPEPATMALAAIGGASLLLFRRKK